MKATNGALKQPVVHIIAGPTASGKSALAVEMAQAMNGVVINCDSIQIYDALPILGAQPSAAERAAVPHRLYGALHPNDICSAGKWVGMVRPVIAEVLDAGQVPVVAGGTGLYIQALTQGLSPIPAIPDHVRKDATALQAQSGNPGFHALLAQRDPVMAARIDPFHTSRLLRAWEVLEGTGRSLAVWQDAPRVPVSPGWHFEIHKLIPDRQELYARCNARFLHMVDNGALEEAEAFQARIDNGEVALSAPITKALGFRPLVEYLRGGISRGAAIERGQTETRNYAKRQMTWFRRQS